MKRRIGVPLIAAVLLIASAHAQGPQIDRRVLERVDLPTPGYEAVLIEGNMPIGGREGRHTHPGVLVGYVQSGTLTLEHQDRPPTVYRAGESFQVEPETIHEGINTGDTPVVVIAAFIVQKGKPLTTQVD